MQRIVLFFLLCLYFLTSSHPNLQAQNTVGLISYDPAKAFHGYNLFFPHNQGNVYLLDNCGRIANVWEDSLYKPGNGYHLAENGDLYKCIGRGAASNNYIHAGGGGEALEIRDWDNNLLWRWFYNDSTHRLHHDMAVMPNGNILALAWERKTTAEAIAAGRDPASIGQGYLWPEHIIEVEPIGTDSANIVWEWHAWDHLVQDFDANQANFANPALNPRLIDLNYAMNTNADWHHANALDYNSELDHIMLSIPNNNEIWVIDHSTTTSQASQHFGGAANHGGDLIYRWGNPATYRQGDSSDQVMFFQHDAHWADIELPPTHPDYGKMVIFNNRVGADYSHANIWTSPYDMYMADYPLTGTTWGPAGFDWTYQRPDSTAMHSTGLSSVQRFPNGNTLICVGRFGYTFEITPAEEIVWEYKNPMLSGLPISQGDSLAINANIHFRMHRYPADYPGFSGRDLSPKGYIEMNPDTTCPSLPIWTPEMAGEVQVRVFPNPASDEITLRFGELSLRGLDLVITDMLGREVMRERLENSLNRQKIPVGRLAEGTYIICISHEEVGVIGTFRFVKMN